MRPWVLAAAAFLVAPRAIARPVDRPVDPIRDTFVQPGTTGRALDQKLAQLASLGFSGVVLVAKDGLVVLHKGYGTADRSSGATNDTRTPLPIGSLERIFTAAAIVRLQMEGRIDTRDPVVKYIPDFHDDRPGTPTVHDLLAGDEAGAARLPEIIEKVSGESFGACLEGRLFSLARMRNSWFAGDRPMSAVPIAHGYSGPDASLRRLIPIPGFQVLLRLLARGLREHAGRLAPVPLPGERIDAQARDAGVMITTASDLFMWSLALMGNTVLSEEARIQILNPIDNTVSYGWKLERTARGTPRMASTGDLPGYESGMWIYPSDNLVLVVLVNNDMGWREAVRRTVESSSLGRNYTVFIVLGGLVLLYLLLQGAMRRRVPYRKGRHPRIYP